MPPKKLNNKPKPKSLTNAEYDDIFNAVISKQGPSEQLLHYKSPLVGKSPNIVDAFSPKECASLENSQNTNSQNQNDGETRKQVGKRTPTITAKKIRNELILSSNRPKQTHSESSNNQSESVSTINSEEFRRNSISSTPAVKEPSTSKTMKQKSFREAVKNLKDTEPQLSDTLLAELSQVPTSLSSSLLVDKPLSQPPGNLNQRERLLWLQARRGENVFAQCDNCDKWRLSDVQDPVDLPPKWYCHMNKDLNYNNCSIPEQKLSIYIEADIIVNQFTAGTLVWAKIYSYPWWPAMVDDDPDTEQYYWIEDYDLNVPTSYNVTFFDGKKVPVTRAWIEAKNLKSFKHNLTLDKKPANNKYKTRLRNAKEEALEAMKLPIKERLIKYSFISKTTQRINTPVSTPTSEDETYNLITNQISKGQSIMDDPAAHLKNIFVQKSLIELENVRNVEKRVTKKVTKRRNTTAMATNERLQSLEIEKMIQQRPNKDSSEDEIEPKRITRRRNTRANTSFERDSSFSQDSEKEKKIRKRRKTISEYEPQPSTSRESRISTLDSGKLEKDAKENKVTQKRGNSIPARFSQTGNSQDLEVPRKVAKRRNTRVDSSIERDGSFSQEKKITKRRSTISNESQKIAKEHDSKKDTSQELEKPKKVAKRRNTRLDTSIERDSSFSQDLNKEKKITQRRSTISNESQRIAIEHDSTKKSSQELEKPKKVAKRRNTRVDTSIEMDSSFSQDLSKEKKITKRRSTISNESQKIAKEHDSKEDSLQKLEKPKNVAKRRNTRVDTSIEMDSSFSQDLNKEKKITKRRSTISNESQKIAKEHDSKEDSLQKLEKPKKVAKRRDTRVDTSIEKDSSFSQDLNREKKITKRRSTIAHCESKTNIKLENGNKVNENQPARDSSQNTSFSENNRSRNICDTSVERESSFSDASKQGNKITKRRTTIGKYEIQNSGGSQKPPKMENQLGNETEAKIQRRRKSTLDRNSQDSDVSAKVSKRRNTECDSQKNEYSSQNDNKENKIRRRSRSTIRETSSSQNSDNSQKISKRRSTLANINIERGEDAVKEKKITKRRSTLAKVESDSQNENKRRKSSIRDTDSQRENKISGRKNTIESDSTSVTDISIRSSDGGTKLNRRPSKFVCPMQNVTEVSTAKLSNFTEGSNEPQSETKKARKTLGARKIVSSAKPKNTKGTESGYESAINVKKDEQKKQNLSMILEESPPKFDVLNKAYTIPKKRRQTTDEQQKYIDESDKLLKEKYNDEELECTFVQLSQSLKQLPEIERKQKFMAICKEIVNVDKDLDDPTISAKEKLFYEKLNSSLKEVQEKHNISDDKLMKKVDDLENKLDKIESKEVENTNLKSPLEGISNTSSTVTNANTSMCSDKIKYKGSPLINRQLKKKAGNSTKDSDNSSSPLDVYLFNEDF